MHPRLQEILTYLDERRAELRAAVDAVPTAQRQTRPAADRWSAAEVVEHLAMVEGRMARGIFAKRIDEARANGIGPERETTPVAGSFNAAPVLDRSTPRTAPEPVVPLGAKEFDTAWAELEQVRAGLRSTLTAADGLALGEIRHAHPTLGEMNLYQWALWVGSHEGRHAAQVREIADEMAASKPV